MKLTDLKALLELHGLAPRHRLGQNFLVDPALLEAIPKDAGVQPGERVLEVGPGAGALTKALLDEKAEVLAVELDRGLASLLRERFQNELDAEQLKLIEGDVLEAHERFHPKVEDWWLDGPAPRLVANLPYAISGPFLGRLPARPLLGATLLIQKEVAEKVAFQGAGRQTGPLSIRMGLAFDVRMGRRLPPEVFWPRPKVSSAFLHLEPKADAPGPELDAILRNLLGIAFGQRRKALLSRLSRDYPSAVDAFLRLGLSPKDRPEDVEPETWLAVAKAVRMDTSSSSSHD